MKKYLFFTAVALFWYFLTSCEKLLQPELMQDLSDEQVWTSPIYAEGVLLFAYNSLPSLYDFTSDMATDDAVTNQRGGAASRIAGGEWSSQYNPISKWNSAYSNIFYLNLFLENMHQVVWFNGSTTTNSLMEARLKGEALGLRAYYQFQLLQSHAGKADGELLGYPIISSVLGNDDSFDIPRGSFQACIDSILSDCNRAIALLPAIYTDIGDSEIDRALGVRFINRINGRAVKALKSRATLYAASPAYNSDNVVTKWQHAANAAAELIAELGGMSGLSPTGIDFYNRTSVNALRSEKEIIWYSSFASPSSSMERANFPPSHFGDGRANPSQELVDAFPAIDGYPISLSPQFDPSRPYLNRDSRLDRYIIVNGGRFKNTIINTHSGDPVNGINALETSTRTGYYIKKFMHEGVSFVTGTTNREHYHTYFRVTEIFLNYAEALNEIGGPTYQLADGISALDIIKALRQRAGITNHTYIEGLDMVGFREVIRNERRIELCFEGHRFWDIRRWNLGSEINATVHGLYISPDSQTFDKISVETRNYQPHMIYGPIPYDEVLKMRIKQNTGW